MHTFAHHPNKSGKAAAPETPGIIINRGWSYDLTDWLFDTFFFRGKLRELRQKTADLAQLGPGEKVLDVGCGTGTLALLVQERVGAIGRVYGIDPGPQQIARARAKAARRSLPIDFRVGVIERLEFPDQTFDAVLNTIMMHHLTGDLKRQGLAEIARVLKPGGRLVIADFKFSEEQPGQPGRLGSGESAIQNLPALVKDAGFSQVETEELALPWSPAHVRARSIIFIRAQKN